MWNDEFLSFYSDGVSSLRQVVLVQLHYPISLDPPTYHLLSHLCMDVLGRNALALRVPALAGFLLFLRIPRLEQFFLPTLPTTTSHMISRGPALARGLGRTGPA